MLRVRIDLHADGLPCAGSTLPGGYCRMNLSAPQESATRERGNLVEVLLPPLGLILGGVLGEFSFIIMVYWCQVENDTVMQLLSSKSPKLRYHLEENFEPLSRLWSLLLGLWQFFAKIFFIQIGYCKLKCFDFMVLNHEVPYWIFYKGSKSMVWSNLFNVYYWSKTELFNFVPISKQGNEIILTLIKTPLIVY